MITHTDATVEIEPVFIFTDGACANKSSVFPHKVASGAFYSEDLMVSQGVFLHDATNNQAELWGIILAVSYAVTTLGAYTDKGWRVPFKIVIYTDSTYCKNNYEGIYIWKLNGWKTQKGTDVKNREHWETLDYLSNFVDLEINWVKGHEDNEGNNAAHDMAGFYLKYGNHLPNSPALDTILPVVPNSDVYQHPEPIYTTDNDQYKGLSRIRELVETITTAP